MLSPTLPTGSRSTTTGGGSITRGSGSSGFGWNTMPMNALTAALPPVDAIARPAPSVRYELRARYTFKPPSASTGCAVAKPYVPVSSPIASSFAGEIA